MTPIPFTRLFGISSRRAVESIESRRTSDDVILTFGASVTFTASVPSDATGTIVFYDGTTSIGTGTIANGSATLTTNSLSVGSHSIAASYGGDSTHTPSTSNVLTHVVNMAPSTVTLDASPNPVQQGATETFTATVAPGATGTVTFHDGTVVLGTGTITNGVATLVVTTLTPGTHSITAVYGGDANYVASTSAPASLTVTTPRSVTDFAVTNQTSPQLIPPGASASYQIAITSVTQPFTNSVALTATNLPPGATYTFTPAAVTPGSAGATSTFTVSVPKQSATHRSSQTPLILAALLLPFTMLRTRGKPYRLLIWLIASFALLGTSIGCGVGGYFSLPRQTYVITVTGTSGNLVHNTTATLTVE